MTAINSKNLNGFVTSSMKRFQKEMDISSKLLGIINEQLGTYKKYCNVFDIPKSLQDILPNINVSFETCELASVCRIYDKKKSKYKLAFGDTEGKMVDPYIIPSYSLALIAREIENNKDKDNDREIPLF